jgi:ribonuclease HI
MESGRAASAYIFKKGGNPEMETFRINDWVSSTQAELGAIFKVLENILTSKVNRGIVIFCDSMSALQTLQSQPSTLDPLTYDIIRLALYLKVNRKISISMHWIPSHIGLEYNEKVDDWAKKGTLKDTIDFVIPATVGQIKSTLKRIIKQTTLEELNNIISSPGTNIKFNIK